MGLCQHMFVAVAVIAALLALFVPPEWVAGRNARAEFVAEPIAIDLLYGSDRERRLIESNPTEADLRDLQAVWAVEESKFRDRRAPYLLYR